MAGRRDSDTKQRTPFTVACLHRILSRSNGARGLPPQSLISRGVVLVNVADAARFGLHVTQQLRLTHGGAVTIATAWPSSRIEPGYIALDDSSLHALQVPPDAPVVRMTPPTPNGTPCKAGGKKSSAKKSSSKKKKRTPNAPISTSSPRNAGEHLRLGDRTSRFATAPVAAETGTEAPHLAFVKVDTLFDEVQKARSVELDAKTGVGGIEMASLAKRSMQGRVVAPGSAVAITVLGAECFLRVKATRSFSELEVDCVNGSSPGMAVRVGDETSITFCCAGSARPSRRKTPALAQLGGLDKQSAELLSVAQAAFGDLCEKSGAFVYGPAGTGKSTLARAIATELNVHTEEVHGAAVYAGRAHDGGATTLKAAFSRAAANAPSVLVLDDVDAFARRRGASGSEDNNNNTEDNSAPAELPNLAHNTARLLDDVAPNVFVIATTSRPDAVDPALRRPGRLGVEVELEVPDASGRAAVFRALTSTARGSNKIGFSIEDGDSLAHGAFGCVSADLAGAWGRAVASAVARAGSDAVVTAADLRAALRLTTPSALRAVAVEVPQTRWTDVGGQAAAKARLREAVELPLSGRGRAALAALNLDPPRGILLYGPPGCSKTLLARAVATESKANFVSVRGPELLSKWVGASERAVREVFRRARAAAPAVVFFDEIDALAGSRDGHAGASAHSRVVAQLLAEMDGVGDSAGVHGERVVVIAATNRPDLLDRALLRPGRIDVQIYVGLPGRLEREAVLRVHTRKTPLATDVNVAALAEEKWTGGMSGAEIAALVREAALGAMEENPAEASIVRKRDFENALQRVSRRTTPEMVEFFDRYRLTLLRRVNLLQ